MSRARRAPDRSGRGEPSERELSGRRHSPEHGGLSKRRVRLSEDRSSRGGSPVRELEPSPEIELLSRDPSRIRRARIVSRCSREDETLGSVGCPDPDAPAREEVSVVGARGVVRIEPALTVVELDGRGPGLNDVELLLSASERRDPSSSRRLRDPRRDRERSGRRRELDGPRRPVRAHVRTRPFRRARSSAATRSRSTSAGEEPMIGPST